MPKLRKKKIKAIKIKRGKPAILGEFVKGPVANMREVRSADEMKKLFGGTDGSPATASYEPTGRVKFMEIDTAGMITIRDPGAVYEDLNLKGKFVKVCPVLPASERATFPGTAIANEIRQLGARAVIMAPVFVPDGKKAKSKAPEAKNPYAEVDLWLADQNIDDATRDAVREQVRDYMTREGM